MRTSKLKISNLFGITEIELDGRSVELLGANGTGKTSVIDAIRYALTNSSERECIIREGSAEGEIIIETDTGLYLNRKKRTQQADYKILKENERVVPGPENYLKKIIAPLQLDPVAFTLMKPAEQNRIILDLIEFPWDLNWIREKFGEIPEGVDYGQNILQVLHDIQSENGIYYKTRQDINRDIRNTKAIIEEIAADIPKDYQCEFWESLEIGELYDKLSTLKNENNRIERGRLYRDSYNDKKRGLEAEKMMALSSAEKAVESERQGILKTIERLKAEIKLNEAKLEPLEEKLKNKRDLAESNYKEKLARLEKDFVLAAEYAEKELHDVSPLESEIANAEAMRRHINEYKRMMSLEGELEGLIADSEELTEKIELARVLPGAILQNAVLPIDGLNVVDGVPLINGLPVSNLSDGEKMNLCVDVALSKPHALQIILVDGVERLSTDNRLKLYARCKEKGVQFIATRTTDDSVLEVCYL